MSKTAVPAEAVKNLVAGVKRAGVLAGQQKTLRSQIGASKEQIKQHMIANQLPFVQIDNDLYIALERKQVQPALTPALIDAVYRRFCVTTLKRKAGDEEVNALLQLLSLCRTQLAVTKMDARITTSKPVASLLVSEG